MTQIHKTPYIFVVDIPGQVDSAQTYYNIHVDRKSVVQGKSVDLGGRRIIKKKTTKTTKTQLQLQIIPIISELFTHNKTYSYT